MCYIYGKSNNKIVHTPECRYVKMIQEKNRKYFYNAKKAFDAGYVQCKYCAPIKGYLDREEKKLEQYCRANGVYYYFNSAEGCLDIISKSGKWKIIVNGQRYFIWLYHKNSNGPQEGEFVPGYHSQKVRKSTLMGYMEYIVKHDQFRDREPLYDHRYHIPSKGSKEWKSDKRRADQIRRSNSIRYVKEVLNNMTLGNIAY